MLKEFKFYLMPTDDQQTPPPPPPDPDPEPNVDPDDPK